MIYECPGWDDYLNREVERHFAECFGDEEEPTCVICGLDASIVGPLWGSTNGEFICRRDLAHAVLNDAHGQREPFYAVKIGKRRYRWHGPHITHVFFQL